MTGCVDPAHRGRGYGSALLHWQEAHAAAYATGAGNQVLGANADNTQPASQRLLHDHGYQLAFTVVELSRSVDDAGPQGACGPVWRSVRCSRRTCRRSTG